MYPQRKEIRHHGFFTHSFTQHILLSTYNVPGIQSGAKGTWWRQMPVTELIVWQWRVTMDRLGTSQRLREEKRKSGTSPWQWPEKAPPKNNTSWDLKNEEKVARQKEEAKNFIGWRKSMGGEKVWRWERTGLIKRTKRKKSWLEHIEQG